MLKNNKGITLVALITTVVVMLMLATVTSKATLELVKSSRLNRCATVMYLIKTEADNAYESYLFDGEASHLLGTQTTLSLNISDNEKSLINTSGTWYKWDDTILKNLGIDATKLTKSGGYFLVDYENEEVIYSRGCIKDGEKVYSLTAMVE